MTQILDPELIYAPNIVMLWWTTHIMPSIFTFSHPIQRDNLKDVNTIVILVFMPIAERLCKHLLRFLWGNWKRS